MPVHRSPRAVPAATVATVRPPRRLLLALAAGALVAAMAAAPPAHAAPIDRQLFTWTGRVDREVYITMRGRDVRTIGVDAGMPNRARVSEPLPRGRGDVLVRLVDGRGDVTVIDQPSLRNGFTTTIRIRDPRGGADSYRVIAYWAGDDRIDDRRDRDDRWERNDCGRNEDGRGGWWGRGNRRDDCDDRPGRGNRDRDRNDRGGWDDRGGRVGSGALRWSGRVDDVVEIRIRGQRVDAITRSGRRVEDVNSAFRGGGLPAREVMVTLDRHTGRGTVEVVQQPSAWNNYTAVIRIFDSRGGASFYDLTAFWN